MKSALTLFALLAAAVPALGQCANGSCSPPANFGSRYVYPSAPPAAAEPHGWYRSEDGTLALYWRGEKAGVLDPLAARWQTAGKAHTVDLVETFGLKAQRRPAFALPPSCCCVAGECGCANCPAECQLGTVHQASATETPPIDSPRNQGLLWTPRADGKEHCKINGRDATCKQVREALAGGGAADIPDDAAMPRLLVLGSDQARAKVLDDFSRSTWSSKVIAQGYSVAGPESWATAPHYPAPVDPTIYLLDADGTVRSCTQGYGDGKDGLERALALADKLRNPSGVDPTSAPDLAKKPAPVPTPAPANPDASDAPAGKCNPTFGLTLLALLGAAGFGAGYLLTRKK